MLRVNGTRPNEVYVNNNRLNFIQFNEGVLDLKGVWARSFPLKIKQVDGAKITVNRTRSPYEGATLGEMQDNDTLYWGDIIEIDIQPVGDYVVTHLLINGDEASTEHKKFSVIASQTISAKTMYSAGWHTVFEGSFDSPHHTATTTKQYVLSFPGLKATCQGVRVTGMLMKETDTVLEEFYETEIPFSLAYNKKEQAFLSYADDEITIQLLRPTPTLAYKPPFFRITKVEQFY